MEPDMKIKLSLSLTLRREEPEEPNLSVDNVGRDRDVHDELPHAGTEDVGFTKRGDR